MDGLGRDLQGKATVLRLDVTSEVGGRAAALFGVRAVPALVVVDGGGQAVLNQAGLLRPNDVLAQVDALLHTNSEGTE